MGGWEAGRRLMVVAAHVMLEVRPRASGWDQIAGQWGDREFL